MGQYHPPVCIEAEEGLSPAGMDSGLKEGEQGFSRPSTVNAIVALVAARGGNMPADCSQSPLAHGAWRRVEAAMAARDVPAGESWVFREHRTMAQVIAQETVAA